MKRHGGPIFCNYTESKSYSQKQQQFMEQQNLFSNSFTIISSTEDAPQINDPHQCFRLLKKEK